MPNSKLFRIGYGIIILLVIIFLSTKVDFIFRPLQVFFTTLFFPFLISGVLYYLFRPVVFYLHEKKVPKVLSIVLIYSLFAGLVTLGVFMIGPELQQQFNSLINNFPQLTEKLKEKVIALQQNEWFSRFEENEYVTLENISNYVRDYFNSNVADFGKRISGILEVVTSIITIIVTVPFIVFYLLKDSEGASNNVLKYLPYFQAKEARKIFKDMDSALSSYIQGQAVVCILVGVMMYIGYLIIGIEYSLILAFVAMFTNVIPFIGPFIAIVPALIIGFIDSPFMALKVMIVAVIVQQIDGNITSPYIMGKRLDIHPLTIILILLVAGSLGGLLGMILAVPFYAVMKVIISHTYRLYRLNKDQKEEIIKID
ncbi:AI-2E family transporter [Peribacillus acanthi]|uniref:AI-2E family transporter n=1 Tax=Peribacillus acanthi TaxID=2171554 RepID=UPI000D3E18DA|nr:AI-2E family transporter [Peribacillus acanthi]